MNPLLPLLIMQGVYYAAKCNRTESRKSKYKNDDHEFNCNNPDSWNCEQCWDTNCMYHPDYDPDKQDDEECYNDWDCEHCWNTDCKFYCDNDPDEENY